MITNTYNAAFNKKNNIRKHRNPYTIKCFNEGITTRLLFHKYNIKDIYPAHFNNRLHTICYYQGFNTPLDSLEYKLILSFKRYKKLVSYFKDTYKKDITHYIYEIQEEKNTYYFPEISFTIYNAL